MSKANLIVNSVCDWSVIK